LVVVPIDQLVPWAEVIVLATDGLTEVRAVGS